MAKAYGFNPWVYNSGTEPYQLYVYVATSGGTAFSGNLATTNGHDLFPDSFALNDAVYFGNRTNSGHQDQGVKFRNLQFDGSGGSGENAAGTYTITWEYYAGATSGWQTLTVTDGTTGFTNLTAGTADVTFTPPPKWTPVAVNSLWAFWIRARVSAFTSSTKGGHVTTYVKFGSNVVYHTGDTAGTDDVSMNDLYQQDVSGGWGVITALDSATVGARSYLIDCYIMHGAYRITSVTDKNGYFTDKNCTRKWGPYYCMLSGRTGNIITMGRELVSGSYGDQGVTDAFYLPTWSTETFVRNDHQLLGTWNLYDYKATAIEVDGTYPPTARFASLPLYFSGLSQASKYINCTFEGMNYVDLGSSSSGVKNHITFLQCQQPQLGGGGTINDVGAITSTNGYGLFTLNGDQVVTSLTLTTPLTYLISTYNWDYKCFLVNSTVPDVTNSGVYKINWGFSDAGLVYIGFTVDFRVKDESGNAIQGATVSIDLDPTSSDTTQSTDTIGGTAYYNYYTLTTDASGNTTQKYVLSKKYASSNPSGSSTTTTITDWNYYKITVSKPGFRTRIYRKIDATSFRATGLNWNVSLQRDNLNLAPEVISLS